MRNASHEVNTRNATTAFASFAGVRLTHMAKSNAINRSFGLRVFHAVDGTVSAEKFDGATKCKAGAVVVGSFGCDVLGKAAWIKCERGDVVAFKGTHKATIVIRNSKGEDVEKECLAMVVDVRDTGAKNGQYGDMLAVKVKGRKSIQSATMNSGLHKRLSGDESTYSLEGDHVKHYAGFVKRKTLELLT